MGVIDGGEIICLGDAFVAFFAKVGDEAFREFGSGITTLFKLMYPKDCIFLFDGVLTREECDFLVEMTTKHAVKGRETYGPAANVLADSVNSLEISDAGEKKKVCDLTFDKLLSLCKNFKETYGIEMGGFSSPTLRKVTGATRQHKDGVVLEKQVKNGVCLVSELRNMSIIVALNGDYKGGELCFPEQGRTIKLKRGQAVAFPPYWTHPHYTKELKHGTVRYTVNCWTHEKVVA